jgi:hypothetical protein
MAYGDAIAMNNMKEYIMKVNINFDTDVFKIALYHTAIGSPDGSGWTYSITNEIVVSGYTQNGKTLSGTTVSQDDANNRAKWDAVENSITWDNLGATTIVEARLYVDNPTSRWLLILYEMPDSNGEDYTLNFHADGLFWLT